MTLGEWILLSPLFIFIIVLVVYVVYWMISEPIITKRVNKEFENNIELKQVRDDLLALYNLKSVADKKLSKHKEIIDTKTEENKYLPSTLFNEYIIRDSKNKYQESLQDKLNITEQIISYEISEEVLEVHQRLGKTGYYSNWQIDEWILAHEVKDEN